MFPGRRRSSSWLRTVDELPAALRGDRQDLPGLRTSPTTTTARKSKEALELHEAGVRRAGAVEERRLCYVALTRSERALLVSGHWWNESGSRSKGPSEFLTEIADVLRETGAGQLAEWAPEPAEEDENPLVVGLRGRRRWPVDPLADRRTGVQTGRGAGVRSPVHCRTKESPKRTTRTAGLTDTDVLLEEWARKDDRVSGCRCRRSFR